jgi:quercetin dioxygenase-like cupin family protein
MSDYRIEKWNEADGPDAAMLQTLMEREGYRVFEWSDRAGTTYAKHKHDTDQSHCIISGALELTIEDAGSFVLKAGDRDFMSAGTYHSARVIGEEPVVYLIGEKSHKN